MSATEEEKAAVVAHLNALFDTHKDHEWREVPPCVYCVPCNVRLYQGSIPEWKDPELAAKRAACKHDGEHEGYDEDGWHEMGEGFYWICADCGYKGWYE